jgi:hypothetical protein
VLRRKYKEEGGFSRRWRRRRRQRRMKSLPI